MDSFAKQIEYKSFQLVQTYELGPFEAGSNVLPYDNANVPLKEFYMLISFKIYCQYMHKDIKLFAFILSISIYFTFQ